MDWYFSALLIAISPLLGVLIGLIPSVGALITMILLYPILQQFTPIVLIIFYALLVNARDFSGSVSAISLGVLGEESSIPALRERDTITKHNLQLTALKNTMLGSVIGSSFALMVLFVSVLVGAQYPALLRTDVLGVMISITIFFLCFWRTNNILTNFILIVFGGTLSVVGWDNINKHDILTFGNEYLTAGIPMLPFIFGLYAVPKMLQFAREPRAGKIDLNYDHKMLPINTTSVMRGSVIGSLSGMIPFIGNTISSNLAHMGENIFYGKTHPVHSLSRLTAAETANNASQITMLIPLIVLGIALQPSELVLLDILMDQGWMPTNEIDWKLLLSLSVAIPVGVVITALLCYNFVKRLLHNFLRFQSTIVAIILIVVILDIIYIGYKSDQTLYYIMVFCISYVMGMVLQKLKFDVVPAVLAFLLGIHFYEVLYRLPLLWGQG